MRDEVVLASTHLDSQGHRISKLALEAMAVRTNSEEKRILTVDHDITYPPAGKIVSARVERADDGEYLLIGEREWFGRKKRVPLPNGTYAWLQESPTDHHPFATRGGESLQGVEIGADLFTFGANRARFFEEVRALSDFPIHDDVRARKAFILDPEVVIRLGGTIGGLWLLKQVGKRVGEKVSEEAAEDALKMYRWLRSTVVAAAKYTVPENRPITYVIEVEAKPTVQFVARTRHAESVVDALHHDKMSNTLEEISELLQRFQATRIQFELARDGRWRFNYLITSSGQSIGRPYKIRKRDRRLKALLSGEHGMSVGGSVVIRYIAADRESSNAPDSSYTGQS